MVILFAGACATGQMKESGRAKWCESSEPAIGDNGETLAQLDEHALAEGLECLKFSVGSCWARYNTPGIAPLVLTIAPGGEVQAAVLDGGLAGSAEGACIVSAARRSRFASFSGPAMTVRYPFVMR